MYLCQLYGRCSVAGPTLWPLCGGEFIKRRLPKGLIAYVVIVAECRILQSALTVTQYLPSCPLSVFFCRSAVQHITNTVWYCNSGTKRREILCWCSSGSTCMSVWLLLFPISNLKDLSKFSFRHATVLHVDYTVSLQEHLRKQLEIWLWLYNTWRNARLLVLLYSLYTTTEMSNLVVPFLIVKINLNELPSVKCWWKLVFESFIKTKSLQWSIEN